MICPYALFMLACLHECLSLTAAYCLNKAPLTHIWCLFLCFSIQWIASSLVLQMKSSSVSWWWIQWWDPGYKNTRADMKIAGLVWTTSMKNFFKTNTFWTSELKSGLRFLKHSFPWRPQGFLLVYRGSIIKQNDLNTRCKHVHNEIKLFMVWKGRSWSNKTCLTVCQLWHDMCGCSCASDLIIKGLLQ